jgi:hypothetical protein
MGNYFIKEKHNKYFQNVTIDFEVTSIYCLSGQVYSWRQDRIIVSSPGDATHKEM